jgi:hypothetical protein
MSLTLAAPAFGKQHKETFNVPCSVLWSAVKDVLKNSGKYQVIGMENSEMTASFYVGGALSGQRVNSVVLNSKEQNCEMVTQTVYSGLIHNDAGDFKKRVEESLARRQAAQATPPAQQPPAQQSPTPPPAAQQPPAQQKETPNKYRPST